MDRRDQPQPWHWEQPRGRAGARRLQGPRRLPQRRQRPGDRAGPGGGGGCRCQGDSGFRRAAPGRRRLRDVPSCSRVPPRPRSPRPDPGDSGRAADRDKRQTPASGAGRAPRKHPRHVPPPPPRGRRAGWGGGCSRAGRERRPRAGASLLISTPLMAWASPARASLRARTGKPRHVCVRR